MHDTDIEFGFFLKIAHPAVTTVLTEVAEPVTLILDAEHGAFTDADLEVLCALIRRSRRRSVVRVSHPDALSVGRALDRGADGVMVPRAQSIGDVEIAVRGVRTPPKGTRGWDPTTAAEGYGIRKPDPQPARLLIQIETAGALVDAEKIAALPGVTDLFVGPADLSLAIGTGGQLFAPEVIDAVEALPSRVNGTGVGLGLFVDSPERAAWAASLGYTFLAVGADVALLSRGSVQKITEAQAAIALSNSVSGR